MESNKPCRNCNKSSIDSLRQFPEQICRPCLKVLPRTLCVFCQKDFHQLASLKDSVLSICWKCSAARKEHGDPKPCQFCQKNAAFDQEICRHCQKDSEKYGLPIECDSCHKHCAFNKPSEVKDKVGGQNLCYLCTRSFKLIQHRNKKNHQHLQHHESSASPVAGAAGSSTTATTTSSSTTTAGATTTSSSSSLSPTVLSSLTPRGENGTSHKRPLNSPHSSTAENMTNKRQKLDHSNAYSMSPTHMCFNCKTLQSEFDEYKKQMETRLVDYNKRVEDVSKSQVQLEENLKNAKQSKKDLERQHKLLLERDKVDKTELEESKKKLERLHDKLEKLQSEKEQLLQQVSTLQEQNESLDREQQGLKQSNEELQQQQQLLVDGKADREQVLKVVEERNVALKQTQTEYQNLQQRFAVLQQRQQQQSKYFPQLDAAQKADLQQKGYSVKRHSTGGFVAIPH